MQPISSEGYHHVVNVWTVGQLRRALADLADDTPLAGSIPQSLGPRPCDSLEDDDWILAGLEVGPPGEPPVLQLDRPTGRYVHIHREEEGE
ncbi:hypothetical protein HHL19_35595 [Streptomyces sp. R302]|uniref:DUF6225 family protein n=1 Tax=unclassified Streptomyces TaxID=2593676 RepID=UPI00145D9A7C|nr:hypothetical protein [Streptomyces sp. R301]NML83835.1 hypothetical protein [Streptomyces sp. R302]